MPSRRLLRSRSCQAACDGPTIGRFITQTGRGPGRIANKIPNSTDETHRFGCKGLTRLWALAGWSGVKLEARGKVSSTLQNPTGEQQRGVAT